MGFFSTVDRRKSGPTRASREHGAGEEIYRSGNTGLAWRVGKGVVRLDTGTPNGERRFASLAIAGDILGCETLLFGAYTFTASALTHCELRPWPEGESATSGDSLLASLAQAQQRAAEVIALRGGQAVDRVLGLARLLADGAGRVVLPTRHDIADITDLRFETISRIVKQLERSGILVATKIDGVHATRGYCLRENNGYAH
ncbi:MAG: Crp/Fnr family transcriptional regulator [Azonexaceae bacterium]|nr:Crp/Fnr family transcriptional regulator [Azonexaceae bacterium]